MGRNKSRGNKVTQHTKERLFLRNPRANWWTPGYPLTKGPLWVNVYEVDQRYGGPEEGGWWYTAGCPVLSMPVKRGGKWAARRIQRKLEKEYPYSGSRYSCAWNKRDDYEVRIERQKAAPFPSHRPHYC